MPETAPKLVAVPKPPERPAPSADEGRSSTRAAFWVLLIAVVLCALVAAYQTQQVDALTGQVVGLEAGLAVSRAEVAAYEAQLGEIRINVNDLRSRFGALDELVQRDPAATPTP